MTAAFLFLLTAPGAWAQSFTVTAAPSLTIHPGDQNVPLAVTVSSSAYTGPISITLTGLPSGITVAPLTLTAGSSGNLLLSASVSADREAFPANNPAGPTSIANTVAVVAAAGAVHATAGTTLTVSIENPSFTPAPGKINLPIVTIDTNGAAVTSTETEVPGTITITSADGQTSYLPNSSDTDNTATFHVHGNSTAVMPKKAYNVKLNTSLDLLSTMGLSCPYNKDPSQSTCDKSKSYILLANYDDKTLLRDWSASALANAIPMGNGYLSSAAGSPSPSKSALMPWAPHSLFVEVYLNGQYEGNYQLIEKANVDSHRINISELSESDTGAGSDDITGGYLMEIDQHKDEAFVFTTPLGAPIGLQDPDFTPDPEVPAQTSYISQYVTTAESSLPTTANPQSNWRSYFDEAAAVNFYIVNDVMGNVDGGDFYSSVYLYKDKDNPLLYMGPIWDFDISSGNVNYYGMYNPTIPWMQTEAVWYRHLFLDPTFKADVATQFNALQSNGVFTTWLDSISQQAKTLQQSQANNFGRWPMQGVTVWPNREAEGSYSGELAYMTSYIKLRIAYLDSVLNAKTATTTTETVSSQSVRDGAPVTLNAQVSASGGIPPGTVTFFAPGYGDMPSATVDAGGKAVATVSTLPPGTYNISAIYSGNSQYALSSSAVTSITVLPALIETTTSISSSASAATPGESLTFHASVIATSGTAMPTGGVTFTSNGSSLGSATLAADGTVIFSTTSLPVGSDSIQAVYSGDSNYQISTSPLAVIAVQASGPTFALTAAPVTTGPAVKSSTFNLTVTPQDGFNQSVSFSCSPLPKGAACAFSPATVTPGAAPVTTVLTISRSAQITADGRSHPPIAPWGKLAGGIAFALLLWPASRRRAWPFAALLLMVVAGLTVTACGSGNQQQPTAETYPITVFATGGGVTQYIGVQVTLDN